MSRLAIVIRAVGGIESLERTLVSVLENRPADSEIVVALDRPYSDPYELKGEVRFVQATHRSAPVDCVNQALDATRAPFVHLLSSGCTVTAGWTEPALARFGDRQIAAVAPLVMDAERSTHILAAGLRYHRGGRRSLNGRGETERCSATQPSIVGACGFAAFYRTAALELVGGMSPALGLAQADVDLALTLAQAGLNCVLEPNSRVFADPDTDALETPFRESLHEERLFWRNLPRSGRGSAVVAHLGLVAVEIARGLVRPTTCLRLAGRALACCQIGHYARHHATLDRLRENVRDANNARQDTRVDASHEMRSSSQTTQARARSR
jgi:hypothetical protein